MTRHHRSYYRTVNGKVIHVEEGGEQQGRPAELHERTAIGKHRSGSHYLRASDAEDGAKIKRAADELGVHMEKRRSGANHFGKVGAFDHYHTANLNDAQRVHAHLKRGADERHEEPRDNGERSEETEDPVENTTRVTRPVHTPNTPDELSNKAWASGREAHASHRRADETKRLHAIASDDHRKAGAAHLKAADRAEEDGDENAREHTNKASHHFAQEAEHMGHSMDMKQHAVNLSVRAAHLTSRADDHELKENHHSYDAHSSNHLMAIEAHSRAQSAYHSAAMEAHLKGDEQGSADLTAKAGRHGAKMAYHNAEMGKAHGEMRKRRDAAQNLGDVASTPAEHRAAAVAHRHAARIQFDSELRAGHEQAAAGHAKQGQEAAAPAENPAKRKAIDATSRAQVATDKADRENTPEAHDKAAQAHGEARQAHFDAQPSEFNHPDAEIHRIARRGHGDNEERHEAAARRLRAGTKPTEPTRNAPHGYTEANIRSHDALESAELAEDNTPEGRKAHQLSDDAHSLTAWKRSHTDAADAHGKAAKAHRDLHASTPNRYHKEAAEHHEAMVGYHKQADPARNTAPERPMQKAIIEARILNLDIQADRVGGDPIALAALEMRRKALANNDKK